MKKIIYLTVIFTACFFTACTTDDVKPLILQAGDVTTSVLNTATEGDLVGIVPGTSNRGSIGFTIDSQTPEGVFTLNETGELLVGRTPLGSLDIGTQVVLQVSVSKEGSVDTSNVTVVIEDGVDISPWDGFIEISGDSGATVTSADIELGNAQLRIIQIDPFNLGCTLESEIILQLSPLNATTGTVTITSTDYLCGATSTFTIEGIGTYDIETETILLDYTTMLNGAADRSGSVVIIPTDPIIPVDLSQWVGTLNVAGEGFFGPVSVDVSSVDIGNDQIEISGADAIGLGCFEPDTRVIISFGQLTSATQGPITITQQAITCFAATGETLEASGTYNTDTGEIILDFEFVDSFGPLPFTRTITPVVSTAPIDVSQWVGSLNVSGEGFFGPVSVDVSSADIGNNQIEISGVDVIGIGCSELETRMIFSFGQLTSSNEGPITIAQQAITCFAATGETLEASGTYNTDTGEIILDFEFVDSFGPLAFTRTITPVVSTAPIDVSRWVGSLNVSGEGFFGPVSVDVSSADIGNNQIEISGVDVIGIGCSELETRMIFSFGQLTSSNEGPITIAQQAITCFAATGETLEASGTYNTDTGEIVLDFEFVDSFGPLAFTRTITPL